MGPAFAEEGRFGGVSPYLAGRFASGGGRGLGCGLLAPVRAAVPALVVEAAVRAQARVQADAASRRSGGRNLRHPFFDLRRRCDVRTIARKDGLERQLRIRRRLERGPPLRIAARATTHFANDGDKGAAWTVGSLPMRPRGAIAAAMDIPRWTRVRPRTSASATTPMAVRIPALVARGSPADGGIAIRRSRHKRLATEVQLLERRSERMLGDHQARLRRDDQALNGEPAPIAASGCDGCTARPPATADAAGR